METPVIFKQFCFKDLKGPERSNKIDRFKAEIGLMGTLRHPNLCLMLGALLDTEDSSIYIIMERLSQSLFSKISTWKENAPLDEDSNAFSNYILELSQTIIKIAEQTCLGMMYMHN